MRDFSSFGRLPKRIFRGKFAAAFPGMPILSNSTPFFGPHQGLHIAEVEFSNEKSIRDFEKPEWFGKEITGDPANVNLAIS
jgi:CYTH domain-containing protein